MNRIFSLITLTLLAVISTLALSSTQAVGQVVAYNDTYYFTDINIDLPVNFYENDMVELSGPADEPGTFAIQESLQYGYLEINNSFPDSLVVNQFYEIGGFGPLLDITYRPYGVVLQGQENFMYTICNWQGECVEAQVTIYFEFINNQPSIIVNNDSYYLSTAIPVQTLDIFSNDNINILNPADNAGLLSITNLPAHGTLTLTIGNQSVTAELGIEYNIGGVNSALPIVQYSLNSNTATTDSFTYTVCNSANECDSANVELFLTPNNIVANNDTYDVYGTNYTTVNFYENDEYPIIDTWTIYFNNLPAEGTLYQSGYNGSLSNWYPVTLGTAIDVFGMSNLPLFRYQNDQVPASTDVVAFEYVICDNINMVCDTATVNIQLFNEPALDQYPIAIDDYYTAVTGQANTIVVAENDFYSDAATTTFTILSSTNNGTISPNSNPVEAVIYTPNAGYFGPDQFSYHICDLASGSCDTAYVAIDVVPQINESLFCYPDSTYFVGAGMSSMSFHVTNLAQDLSGTGLYFGDVFTNTDNAEIQMDEANMLFSVNFTDPLADQVSVTYNLCNMLGDCCSGNLTFLPSNNANLSCANSYTVPIDYPNIADVSIFASELVENGNPATVLFNSVGPDSAGIGTATIIQNGTMLQFNVDIEPIIIPPTEIPYTICDANGNCCQGTIYIQPLNTENICDNIQIEYQAGQTVTIHPAQLVVPDADPEGNYFTYVEQGNDYITTDYDQNTIYITFSNQANNTPENITYEMCSAITGLCCLNTIDIIITDEPAPFTPICGQVFIDVNADGIYQASEQGLENVEIEAIAPDGQSLFATTDSLGYYTIFTHTDGQYMVHLTSDLDPNLGIMLSPNTPNLQEVNVEAFSNECVYVDYNAIFINGVDCISDTISLNYTYTGVPLEMGACLGLGFSTGNYTQPENGYVYQNNDCGLFYEPNPGFTGTDKIYYQQHEGDFVATCHTVEANIEVSTPSIGLFGIANNDYYETEVGNSISANFTLNDLWYVNTLPIINIDYNSLIGGSLTDNQNGSFTFEPEANFAGVASFNYQLCVANPSACVQATVYIVVGANLLCTQDCVYPGDANNDGLANNYDVLALGLAYGLTGPSRIGLNPNIPVDAWVGQYAEDWNAEINIADTTNTNGVEAVNAKYTDCNADGIVNENDMELIDANYGLFHFKTETEADEDAPLLSIQLPDYVEENTWVTAEIHAGDINNIINAHGIAFTLNYDNNLVNPTTVHTRFDNGFLNENSSSQELHFHKNFYNAGQSSVAYSRVSTNNAQAYGKIGEVDIFIIDNIDGKNNSIALQLNISNAFIITANGERQQLNTQGDEAEIVTTEVPGEVPVLPLEIETYPIPSDQGLNIQLTGAIAHTGNIHIANLMGQVLWQAEVDPNHTQWYVNTQSLRAGMYFVSVQTKNAQYTKRIIIAH